MNNEIHLLKEKESEPFDISEYEFSEVVFDCICSDKSLNLTAADISYVVDFSISKQDAIAIAKHFKLI